MPMLFLFTLIVLAAAYATIIVPTHFSLGTALRVLALMAIGFVAPFMFRDASSSNTVAMLLLIALPVLLYFVMQPYRITIAPLGRSTFFRAEEVEKPSLVVAGGASVILLTMTSLQVSSAAIGASQGRGDIVALVAVAICLACWTIVVSALTLPWKLHRRWTVPALIVAGTAFISLVPAAWLLTSYDAARDQGIRLTDYADRYTGGGQSAPFSTATSAAGNFSFFANFGFSTMAIWTNCLAVLMLLFALAQQASARYFVPRSDEGELDEYIVERREAAVAA